MINGNKKTSQLVAHKSAMFFFLNAEPNSEMNPSPKHNGLGAIFVCMDLPEIVDHPGTFGILFSTYYALGHTYSNLTYYLRWKV